MKKRYGKELSVGELAAVTDEDIDTSDIPDLDKASWDNDRVVMPEDRGRCGGL